MKENEIIFALCLAAQALASFEFTKDQVLEIAETGYDDYKPQPELTVVKQDNKKGYYLFNDLTLETPDETTQIDHVIISRFGIFVIETKNFTGWIFGSENQKQWTKTTYGNKVSG